MSHKRTATNPVYSLSNQAHRLQEAAPILYEPVLSVEQKSAFVVSPNAAITQPSLDAHSGPQLLSVRL